MKETFKCQAITFEPKCKNMKQYIVARTGVLTQALITSDAGMFSKRKLLKEALTLTLVHALIAMVAKLGVSAHRVGVAKH